MKQYIDKSAVVAEIKKRIIEIDKIGTYLSPKGVLTNLLCLIDTFETKEVDITDRRPTSDRAGEEYEDKWGNNPYK